MTTFNSDYSNNELLDQELTTSELSQVSGGMSDLVMIECVDPDPAWSDPANHINGGGYEPPTYIIHRNEPSVNFLPEAALYSTSTSF